MGEQPGLRAGAMLTEDEVVKAVCRELESRGWEIMTRATVNQRGYDIVAARGDRRLVIEAKGAGSSKPGTRRYGSEFDRGQVFDHVAKAVLKALRVVAAGESRAGIALPDNEKHRREIEQVLSALDEAGIAVFWVRRGLEVAIESPWDV
jgi:hypothetical protein